MDSRNISLSIYPVGPLPAAARHGNSSDESVDVHETHIIILIEHLSDVLISPILKLH